MENKKFAFTKRRLESLNMGPAKRERYQDEASEGLNLYVTPAGNAAFYLVKWFQGRKVEIKLGAFPTMSVEEARKECRALVTKMADGTDVAQVRKAKRHEQTLKGLWEFWLEHAKANKKSWKQDERLHDLFLGPWLNRRLSAIHKSDVAALHTTVGKNNGHYQANRLLSLLLGMFNKAGDIGFNGANPAKGVKRFKEEKRDRFLAGDELPKFFQALLAEPNELIRDYFLLVLLTGARRANVESMAWKDIDLAQCYWRIPETKGGNVVVVPLVPDAVAVLQARYEARGGSLWVFPTASATGHLTSPNKAFERLLKRAGLVNLRIHDLRRTLGSWQAIGGASLTIIGKSLGHTQVATTAIYARLSMDPVRQSVQSATQAMMKHGKASIGASGLVIDVPSVEGGDNGQA